jgi:integrase
VLANTAMQTLGMLWNFAARRDPTLPRNPVTMRLRDEKQWFKTTRRGRYVPDEQLPKFFAAVKNLSNPITRDYILLLMFTGLRRTEAATMTWGDVDFDHKVFHIPAEHTKTDQRLDLPMTDFVHALLVQRRSYGDAKYVFPANSGSGRIEEPKHGFDEIAAATGIRVSAHDLRRTYITLAESCDLSWLAVKALVNHSVGHGITEGYVQMTVERLRAPAQKVADRLKALCGVVDPTGKNVTRLRR